MDPKGIAKYGPYEDNQPTQGQFRRLVVFNDGSKGWEIYEYGTDGPINTPEPDPKLGTDTKQAADYLDYLKKAKDLEKQPNPASQSETISAPPNQEWILRDGPNGLVTIKNPNHRGEDSKKKPVGPPYKNQQQEWVQRFDDGSTQVLPPEVTPFEKPDTPKPVGAPYEAEGGWLQRYDDGSVKPLPPEQAPKGKPEKPTLVELPNGQRGALIPDPSQPSGFRVEPIAGTGKDQPAAAPSSAYAWRPDYSKPDLGLGDRQQQLVQMVNDGVFGDDRAKAEQRANDIWKNDYTIARDASQRQTMAGQNVYAGETSQRNTDVNNSATRLSQSQATYGRALSALEPTMATAARGGATGESFMGALQQLLQMGTSYAEQWGGLTNYPRVAPPPTMTALSGYDPNSLMGGSSMNPAGVTVSINTGQPQAQVNDAQIKGALAEPNVPALATSLLEDPWYARNPQAVAEAARGLVGMGGRYGP